MAKHKFKAGNKFAPGGSRPNAGRDADWLKEKCRELIDRNKLVDFLSDVANGERLERHVTEEGEVIEVPASVKDRMKAIEMLMDRGFGKAVQGLEVGGPGGGPISVRVVNYT